MLKFKTDILMKLVNRFKMSILDSNPNCNFFSFEKSISYQNLMKTTESQEKNI